MKKSRLIFAASTQSKSKPPRNLGAIAVSVGVCTLLLGGGLLLSQNANTIWGKINGLFFKNSDDPSAILSLTEQSAQKRAAKLTEIASGSNSPNRSRARYLLAADLIEQKQGEQALKWLEGLDWDYSQLAPYIALKKAQAYEAMGDKTKAEKAWQELLQRYPDQPTIADALTALGRTKLKDWEKAIAKFPSHPQTLAMVRQWLKQDPQQPQLIFILAKYASEHPQIVDDLDRLTAQPKIKLKPEEWEAVASNYWENKQYGKASKAYIRSPKTAANAYRIARGLQLGDKKAEARTAYRALLKDFPTAKEAAVSLIRLSTMYDPSEGISYLEEAIARFPDKASDALMEKAKIFDKMKLADAAKAARQLLLKQYSTSEAAAEYRWTLARQRAAAGDFQGAWQWAKEISSQNPKSQVARQAAFWEGKWASRLGKKSEAKATFEKVVANYPQSYYAWRSAVMLGWQVGDFNTVRQMNPEVISPQERSKLPVGSEILQELHWLGQDQDALRVWQAEFQNRLQPTVAEQFTDGVLRVAAGDRLRGISKLETLENRELPEEQTQFEALREQAEFWQTLYPFPFMTEVEKWSEQRHLNPLLVIALIRQESRFEPNIRSGVGATGLMQVMPSTGAWIAPQINLLKYQLKNPSDNIQLGTWFLDHTHQAYKNNSMLAVASYNAGPGNVAKWLQKKGMSDPDEFVEAIPFDETRGYVKNVFGNYWNYLRLYNPEVSQLAVTKTVKF